MSIYNTIAYSEETFPQGTYWTEISNSIYRAPEYFPWIIAFNYADLDKVDRHSVMITQEIRLKFPDLAQEFFDMSALPPWRRDENS